MNRGEAIGADGEEDDDYEKKLDQVPLRSPSEGSLPREYDEVFAPHLNKRLESLQEIDLQKIDSKATEDAAVHKVKKQVNVKGKAVVKDGQRSQIEKENKIDTANMLYTKEELDMLKKLSPED